MRESVFLMNLPCGKNSPAASKGGIVIDVARVGGLDIWTFITALKLKTEGPIYLLTYRLFAGPVIGPVILN